MLNSTVWQLRDRQAGSNGVPVRGALKKSLARFLVSKNGMGTGN